MDELFEKLKAEKPVNKLLTSNKTLDEAEPIKKTQQIKTSQKTYNKKNSTTTTAAVEQQEKSTPKVPTKAEMKCLHETGINEDVKQNISPKSKKTNVKPFQVLIEKYNIEKFSPTKDSVKMSKANEKVSTKAEKKQFTTVPKKQQNEKSTIPADSKSPTNGKKKRKATKVETNVELTDGNREKLPQIKNCVVRLKRLGLSDYKKYTVAAKKRKLEHEKGKKDYQKYFPEKLTSITGKQDETKRKKRQAAVKATSAVTPVSKKSRRNLETKICKTEIEIKSPGVKKTEEKKNFISETPAVELKEKTNESTVIAKKADKTRKNLEANGDIVVKTDNLNMEKLIEVYGKRTFNMKVRLSRWIPPLKSNGNSEVVAVDKFDVSPDSVEETDNVLEKLEGPKNKKNLSVSFLDEVEVMGHNNDDMEVDSMEEVASLSMDESNVTNLNVDTDIMSEIPMESMDPLAISPTSELTSLNVEIVINELKTEEKTSNENLTIELDTEKRDDMETLLTEEEEEEEEVKEVTEEIKDQPIEEKVEELTKPQLESVEDPDLYEDAERDVITPLPDAINGCSLDEPESESELCTNNTHSHDLQFHSENSNDSVIKNDVMMHDIVLSKENDKPMLNSSCQDLDFNETANEYRVVYSPASFRSANSDMETQAEKGSDTKLSDVSDMSNHDADMPEHIDTHDFSTTVHVDTEEVSLHHDDVVMPLDNASTELATADMSLSVSDDVSVLLENMEDIADKIGSMEVDKLNATISLIDDSNPNHAGLTLDAESLGVGCDEAPSIVDSIITEKKLQI